MATKTINLKMVLDRSDKGKELRQALWTTHEEVNKAVAEIERILLLCRGRSYVTRNEKGEEVEVKVEDVRRDALAMAREAQNKNGKGGGTDTEILQMMQDLYAAVIDGDSQEANKFASPLMDASSKAGAQKLQKIIEPLPDWMRLEDGWESAAEKWIKSTDGQMALAKYKESTGRKSGWVNDHSMGKPTWAKKLVADQEKQREEAGAYLMIAKMQDKGLFPLVGPLIRIDGKSGKARGGITKWDRLAVRLAVAHMLSWKSWNDRCKKNYDELSAIVSEKKEKVDAMDRGVIAAIRAYEEHRHEELKKHSPSEIMDKFRINPRMVRAYDRVKEKWTKCRSEAERKAALAALQAELRGKYGDPDLYLWLAKDENQQVWQNDGNAVVEVAQLNTLEWLLGKRKPQSTYTEPDAIRHPRWMQFEAEGGANLRNYKLTVDNGMLAVELPLMTRTTNGIKEKDFTIRLAKSGQIEDPEVVAADDETRLTFSYGDEPYTASMGGSDILFDRAFLEHRKPEDIRDGIIGPVWFKLVLDVDPKAPEGWLDSKNRPKAIPAINHFRSALGSGKHEDEIEPGLRVLAVDLGIRTFASCAVFELVMGKPQKGLYWLAHEAKDLWARHERSFVLAMPGEGVSGAEEKARREAEEVLGGFEQGRMLLRTLLRLAVVEDTEERREKFEVLCSGKQRFTGRDLKYQLSEEEKHRLEQYLGKPLEVWKGQVMTVFKGHEKKLSADISEWRKKTSPKQRERDYAMGKSYWGIKYLEDVRDLLKGWSTHARQYGQITRWDREKLGTFANRLLEHINNKKEDRVKTGADLIIQSARGMVYDDKTGKWEKKFEPCRLILFEDLAMYRFRTDRPRRENSQLMRWSHRAILDEVRQQAAIYGIHVDTTGAGFSSKFYAKNGCPGRRATKLDADLIAYIQSDEARMKRLADDGFGKDWLKEGNIIPWDGGEFFMSLSGRNKLEIIHADINASQNLQRRFWTRYADVFRVPVTQIAENVWVPQSEGKRLMGGLSMLLGTDGPAKFVGSHNGFTPEKLIGKRPQSFVEEEGGLDELTDELIESGVDVNIEEGKGKAVLFRDASGLILRSDRFYEQKEFWGRVHSVINKALREKYGRGKA